MKIGKEISNKFYKIRTLQIIICFFCIVYITLISRSESLYRKTNMQLFWSYAMLLDGKTQYADQILLNIVLFIPFGFLLATIFRPQWVIIISFVTSASVELAQFLSYRGTLDADDLVSNVLGTIIGIVMWEGVIKKKSENVKKITSFLMISAGLIGCIITAIPNSSDNTDLKLLKQFYFSIDSMDADNGLMIKGQCYIYDRPNLPFAFLINGNETEPETDGNNYKAEIALPSDKAEVLVLFQGYKPMSTGTWINPDGKIEYVAEDVVNPSGVPSGAVLKAYAPSFQTYVYEYQGKILWFIGWEQLDANTEIICHLYSNEPEKLPEHRKKYGNDNRGFRPKDREAGKSENEWERIGNYRVFERELPTEYNIVAIVVGFNTDGEITWKHSFRTSPSTKSTSTNNHY